MEVQRLPMFPLERALLPYDQLPLHIFEPRYRTMIKDCLGAGREFGVVLIERGSEVGGGDQRFAVGTLAHVVQAVELPDGRFLIHALGIKRIRVSRWLDDDPYPLAEVTVLADAEAEPGVGEQRRRAEQLLRQVCALRAELGDPAAKATLELADDPAVAAYQGTILACLSPMDGQRILEADGPSLRLELLIGFLDEIRDTLSRRIAQG